MLVSELVKLLGAMPQDKEIVLCDSRAVVTRVVGLILNGPRITIMHNVIGLVTERKVTFNGKEYEIGKRSFQTGRETT